MKKLILFAVLLSLVTLTAGAQDLKNSNNSTIGKIESDGTVRNGNNSAIGKVESDGMVRNGNNAAIGKIEKDGTVRNGNNSTIGYAKDVPKAKAAVFFFFNFF